MLEETRSQLCDLIPTSFQEAWDVKTVTGDPADAIVRVAQEGKMDFIVMGSHGHTGLRNLLLGSVAEKVLRHAPCPVCIVRHDGERK
jgi:universal stress protein A